ncbi:RDD family protein [Actinomadura hibisca]|uniref:RDD family protein n=1 Tax=Actinomadura hibisca TaxID=68565 RepID=UPI00082C6642|nr:RDD family protein [Actinomadura hibisca]
MSESPHRGGQYPPPGGPSYGPPPSYQGSQWQSGQQPQPRHTAEASYGAYDEYGGYGRQGGYEGGYEGGGYQGDAADLPLAPIGRRAVARIADNALVAVFGFALVVPVTVGVFGLETSGSKTSTEGAIWNWPIIFTLFAVLAVIPFVYEAVQLSLWGRTLGKRITHLGVVQRDPAGAPITTAQAAMRAGVTHLGYQIGVFFFLVLAVKVWEYAAYGMLLAWIGGLMAYLWAIWDQPLRQSLHDRLSGTVVIDERVEDGDHDGHGHDGHGHGGYGH